MLVQLIFLKPSFVLDLSSHENIRFLMLFLKSSPSEKRECYESKLGVKIVKISLRIRKHSFKPDNPPCFFVVLLQNSSEPLVYYAPENKLVFVLILY